jgi:23S rRNA-/tRNA-specific pseudouridylate synthase
MNPSTMKAWGQLRVLHETRHVLVIDKPAGLPFHQPPGTDQPGVLQLCRSLQEEGQLPTGPLFPVHR